MIMSTLLFDSSISALPIIVMQKLLVCGFVQPLIGNGSWGSTVVRQVSFTLLVCYFGQGI